MTKVIGAYWQHCPVPRMIWVNMREETLLLDPSGRQGIKGAVQVKPGCPMEIAISDLLRHPKLLRWLRRQEEQGILRLIGWDRVH